MGGFVHGHTATWAPTTRCDIRSLDRHAHCPWSTDLDDRLLDDWEESYLTCLGIDRQISDYLGFSGLPAVPVLVPRSAINWATMVR